VGKVSNKPQLKKGTCAKGEGNRYCESGDGSGSDGGATSDPAPEGSVPVSVVPVVVGTSGTSGGTLAV